MSSIYSRLDPMSHRFDEIAATLADTSRPFDQERYTALVKERAQLAEPVETYREYEKLQREIAANDALLAERGDAEMHALAEEEARALHDRRKALEERLQLLMIPTDPNDAKDVFIEIRAGAG